MNHSYVKPFAILFVWFLCFSFCSTYIFAQDFTADFSLALQSTTKDNSVCYELVYNTASNAPAGATFTFQIADGYTVRQVKAGSDVKSSEISYNVKDNNLIVMYLDNDAGGSVPSEHSQIALITLEGKNSASNLPLTCQNSDVCAVVQDEIVNLNTTVQVEALPTSQTSDKAQTTVKPQATSQPQASNQTQASNQSQSNHVSGVSGVQQNNPTNPDANNTQSPALASGQSSSQNVNSSSFPVSQNPTSESTLTAEDVSNNSNSELTEPQTNTLEVPIANAKLSDGNSSNPLSIAFGVVIVLALGYTVYWIYRNNKM